MASISLWALPFLGMTLFAALMLQGCGKDPGPDNTDNTPSPMAELLKEIARESDPLSNIYLNERRVTNFQSQLESETNKVAQLHILSQYPLELLRAGQPREAIETLDSYLELLMSLDPDWVTKTRANTQFFRATCYLRLAEQENCILHHTTDSCLFPIQGSGVHVLTEGASEALNILGNLLEADPASLKVQWLYNIAGMTLGLWPDQLDPRWTLPEESFESEWTMPRLNEVAKESRCNTFGLAGGCVMEDFNQDGHLDLMLSSWGFEDPLTLLINDGTGHFDDVSNSIGLEGITGGLNMIHADYNNDGYDDVLVLRGGWMGKEGRFPNSLLKNNGDGTFTDVTMDAGLLSFHPTQTAVWLDVNLDGWLDLFVGNESTSGFKSVCELFINQKDGTFKNQATEFGLDISAYVKGVVSADFNNDGWPDLYLSCLAEPNRLMLNWGNPGTVSNANSNRGKQFVNAASIAGVEFPIQSFTTWAWDYDNDGWEDLWVSDYQINDVGDIAAEFINQPHQAERGRLYRNNKDGTFVDVSRETGLDRVFYAMGANFGDLDSDGFLDMYIGTGDPELTTLMPNRFFRNDAGQKFLDATTASGLGHLQKGHGVGFGDVDKDGDLDIYAVMGGAFSGDGYWNVLFQNPGHENQWLELKLRGVTSNRSAIGTRIKVTVEDPDGKTRSIFRTVSTGGSFGSNPLTQHIGLGKIKRIQHLEIYWPTTQAMQVFESPEPNRAYKITETDEHLE